MVTNHVPRRNNSCDVKLHFSQLLHLLFFKENPICSSHEDKVSKLQVNRSDRPPLISSGLDCGTKGKREPQSQTKKKHRHEAFLHEGCEHVRPDGDHDVPEVQCRDGAAVGSVPLDESLSTRVPAGGGRGLRSHSKCILPLVKSYLL